MGEKFEIPSPEEQKEILSSKLLKSVLEGETWYLIDIQWMKHFKQYVGLGIPVERVAHPGPIDNSPILSSDLETLKKALVDKIDYELVSEECWNLLVSWYGLASDQKPIPRKAVSSGHNYTVVEVYLIELKICRNFEFDNELRINVSKADVISSVHETARTLFEVNENVVSRLWLTSNCDSSGDQLLALDKTVQEVGLNETQVLVLETQNAQGKWMATGKFPKSSGYSNIHDFYNSPPGNSKNGIGTNYHISLRSSRNAYINSGAAQKTPGLCGLNNLGNTCFMNSVLQCMSNSPPITEYFLSGRHLEELNTTNPLGMKGEIAKAYGELIQVMWSGLFSCTNPLQFKVQVSKFNPLFCGCQQHDSQELLTFLLDGLHEDLNRIVKKPYIENKDYTGEEDKVVAMEAWSNYLKRNNSIIVDTFHGLLKSRVVCPECERLSITFDPFCCLSLPLPLKKDRCIKIRYIPYDANKREFQYKVTIPKGGFIKDLCKDVGFKTSVSSHQLLVAEITNCHFHKFYSQEESIENIDDRDIIYVYELPVPVCPTANDYMIVPLCFWELCKEDEKFVHNHIFGVPLILVLEKKPITLQNLQISITHHIRRHFSIPDVLREGSSTEDQATLEVECPFVPYILDSMLFCSPTKLAFDEDKDGLCDLAEYLGIYDPENTFGRKVLMLQFTAKGRRELFHEKPADYGPDHSFPRPRERGRIQVYDCLDLFTTCEKLSADDAWYCPTCKKHQRATKKFDLWNLPKILIIHLKRFSYTRCGDKIDALVEFPITDLNMTKYIINPEGPHMTYDLIGVCNHYGSMGGGHYTAYCKHKETGNWYCFDDNSVSPISTDEIMTCAAYVLFYMAKDKKTSETSMEVN